MRPSLLFFLPLALTAQVTPPASTVFDTDAVHQIYLTFTDSNWYDELLADYTAYPDDTPYRQASLVWGTYKFDSVGVRFKGNSSFNGATTKKKPFRIKLNQYTKGQKIDSMANFGLSNAWNDPSFVREKPYYEMAAAAGLVACRSNFAALYVNNEYWGLYILGEIVDSSFVTNHFGKSNDTGNLYKAETSGANLAYLGTDPAAYEEWYSKQTNEDSTDWSDLIALTKVFDQTAVADLKTKLDSMIDVDSFLTALALDNITVNLDSYVGMAQNYYLYVRPSDGKWVWVVWDPSLAFGALSEGLTVTQMENLSLQWVATSSNAVPGGGGSSTTRNVASKMWQVPEYKSRYLEIYKSLLEKQMVPATLEARMTSLRTLISDWVQKDTQKLVTWDQFQNAMTTDSTSSSATTTAPGGGGGAAPGGAGGGGGAQGAPGLQPFIDARVAAVKSLLAGTTTIIEVAATPSSVFLAQTAGGTAGGSQTVALAMSDNSTGSTYTAAASASWITLSATSGSIPASLKISTSAVGMTAGTYTGTVTVTVSTAGNSPLSIPVLMSVVSAAAIVSNPASLTISSVGSSSTTSTTTQTLRLASTAGASAFTVTTSNTTCTNFLSVSPTSGTTPASVTVTINTSTTSASCTGTITAASSGLTPATVAVTLTNTSASGGSSTPQVTSIDNAASYSNGPIAPGTILTIFGTNIGPATLTGGTYSSGQLGTAAGGVQVTFDGTAAPVLYAKSNQVGVVAPFEISGKTQSAVQITYNSLTSPTVQEPVSPTAPGIFTTASTGQDQASVINQDGTINSAGAAAAKGSIVAIYLTGAGVVTASGTTGGVGAANQLVSATVTVTIGGQDATVKYAGVAPGSLLGLYQVNALVPSISATGSVPLIVTVGGVASQNGVTMYVK